MPDDNGGSRLQNIERAIDRPTANALALSRNGGAITVAPQNMGELMEFAKLMAVSSFCVRPAFRGNPGACLAVAMQAFRCGGDPFAWANKAYVTRNKAGEEQISYEAQLIHATVNTSPVLVRRLRPHYEGEGQSRKCRIVGYIRGEDEAFEYESPPIGKIAVKNSPLWAADPDQQLFYYSTRAWARRHVPEVLLGIYSDDEIGETIDITPHPHHPEMEPQPQPPSWEIFDHVGEGYEFENADKAVEAYRRMLIAAAADPQALATVWDNNLALLDGLTAEGHGDDAEALSRLHKELAPREARPAEPTESGAVESQGNGTGAPPAPNAGEAATPQPAASPVTDAAEHPAPPAQEPQDERNPPLPTDSAPASEPAPSAAPANPYAMTAERHDAWWDSPSLQIDPPALARGQHDWKVWPVMLKPRIRQAWSTPTLNALYQDNAGNLDKYGTAMGDPAKEELLLAFDEARVRLGQ